MFTPEGSLISVNSAIHLVSVNCLFSCGLFFIYNSPQSFVLTVSAAATDGMSQSFNILCVWRNVSFRYLQFQMAAMVKQKVVCCEKKNDTTFFWRHSWDNRIKTTDLGSAVFLLTLWRGRGAVIGQFLHVIVLLSVSAVGVAKLSNATN